MASPTTACSLRAGTIAATRGQFLFCPRTAASPFFTRQKPPRANTRISQISSVAELRIITALVCGFVALRDTAGVHERAHDDVIVVDAIAEGACAVGNIELNVAPRDPQRAVIVVARVLQGIHQLSGRTDAAG